MGQEFRIFIQLESFPKSGFFKNIFAEQRSDLYILFPDLPLEYSKTFGLKFRDVSMNKDYIEGNRLELKILKKSQGDGIEIWQKVLSERLDKKIRIIEKIDQDCEEPYYIDNTPVKFNKKEVLEQMFGLIKGDILTKIGENPKIKLALISKIRKQKRDSNCVYEKTFLLMKAITTSFAPEKYFLTYCWEDFKEHTIEDFKPFQKKFEKMSKEHQISPKNFKGYPEFIYENL